MTWLTSLLVAVVSLALLLLAAEGVVRLVHPQRLYYNVSQWDPEVGFSPIPNIEGMARHEEYTMRIKINSRGLRDREFTLEKPAQTVRIGVFGDAFTFGEGVQAEETYPKRLEQRLKEDPHVGGSGWRVEVLNFGIIKTGTSHQLAWYRKEGRRYGLDIVVLGFLAGSDFYDNLSGVYVLREGKLVHKPAAHSSIRKIQKVVYAIPFYRWLAEHSHLVNLARVVATARDDRLRIKHGAAPMGTRAEAERHSVELTLRLIEAFEASVREQGGEFVIVSLPVRGQKPPASSRGTGKEEPHVKQLASAQRVLEQRGADLLDLIPIFAALPAEVYYYRTDSHMRAAGHEVISEQLHKHLAGKIRTIVGARAAAGHSQPRSAVSGARAGTP